MLPPPWAGLCVMDARERIAETRKRILRRMLGMEEEPRRAWGCRNFYAVGRGGYEVARLRGMEQAGLIRQGTMTDHRIFFHATEAGCRAVGLNEEQRRRALEGSGQ